MKKAFLSGILLMIGYFGFSQTTYFWRNDQTSAVSGTWNNSNNWWNGSSAALPLGGEVLSLDGNVGTTMTNDLPSNNRYRISFAATSAASRTIGGSSPNNFFDFSNNIPAIFNGSGVTNTINFPIGIANVSTSTSPAYGLEINASNGNLTFGSTFSAFNNTGTKVLVLRASSPGTGLITLNGIISNGSGTVSISKIENNTAILGALNTYTGGTTVSSGVLRAGVAQSGTAGPFGNNSDIKLGASGTLDLNGNNATVYAVREIGSSDGGIVTLGAGSLTVSGGWSGTTYFQNSISGNGSLIKQGTGTLSLYGTQSYTGATTISGGELSTAVAMSSTFYNINGGTYRIATGNVISDAANVSLSSGSFAVDQNETINDLTISGGMLNVAAGKTLQVNGTLTLSSAATINLNATGTIIYGANGKLVISTPISIVDNIWPSLLGPKDVTINANVSLNVSRSLSGILTLQSGTLSIAANTLTLNGTITGSGTLTGSATSDLSIGGTGALGTLNFTQTTDGTTNAIRNFTFNRTASGTGLLGIKLVVLNTYTPTAGVLTTGGNLVLRSTDINATARIAAGTPSGGYISGDVTVERHIPSSRRSFRQLSSGVNSTNNIRSNWQISGATTAGLGIHITGSTTGANGFDATQTGAASMFTYTAGAASFTAIPGTDGTNKLDALRGYRVYVIGDRNANLTIVNNSGANTPNIAMNAATTLSATGTLITGSVNYSTAGVAVNGTVTDPTNGLSNTTSSFALIANPYWSPVDFVLITKANIASTYWIWNPLQGDRGAYNSYTVGSGSSAGNITKDIQPGQAIFIQTTASSPSITFNETNKSAAFTNTFRTAAETPSKIRVQLFTNTALSNGGYMQDGTTVAFRDDFSSAVGAEDAAKFTNPDENIAVVRGNTVLGLEGRPTVLIMDTIPLRMWRLNSNYNYTLKLEGVDFDPGITGVLLDKYLNQQHVLNLAGAITLPFSFNADSASFYDRFQLVFRPASTLPVNFTAIKAYRKNTAIAVEWKTANESNISRYEVERSADGRSFSVAGTVAATNTSAASYQWLDAVPFSGNNYYRVNAIGTSGQSIYTSVIRVLAAGVMPIVSVYPNPVKNGSALLKLDGLPAGNYTAQVFNAMGQQVAGSSIITDGGSKQVALPVKHLSSGVYTLLVKGEAGTISTSQLVIEQ